MIKVANIIEEGRLGGPQYRIVEVAGALKEKSIATTVIFPKLQSDSFCNLLQQKNITFKRLPLSRLSKNIRYLLRYIVLFPLELIVLTLHLSKERYDVVHVSGGAWQFKGVIAGKAAGAKVLWHLNDTSMPRLLRFLFSILARTFVDGLIVAGKRVKEYYLDGVGLTNKYPVFVIQAPVDCNHFDPKCIAQDEKNKNHKHSRIHIVSVGNVNPCKGFEYFLHMAALLNGLKVDIQYLIVGPHFESQQKYTEHLNFLKRELRLENLHFYGPCNDVRQLLRNADIYVCSSIAEASPLAVWEAMAMEKAIVSTDVGDVSRFIKDGYNGFIVPVGDPESLYQKVKILIENPSIREKFGKRARQIALEQLDSSIAVSKHAEAYHSILKKSN